MENVIPTGTFYKHSYNFVYSGTKIMFHQSNVLNPNGIQSCVLEIESGE